MIKEFKVLATFEKEMTIKIDTDQINAKWMEDFSSYMFFVDSHEELCEHIGHCVIFNGDDFLKGLVSCHNGIKPKT